MADGLWRWPGPDDLTERAGECYTLAMQAVLANPRLAGRLHLVHGLLHASRSAQAEALAARPEGVPPPNPHAWLEVDADDGVLCLDAVLRLGDERSRFYATFGCETIRRYRADVAVEVALRNGHYGPWDRRSRELWEQRQAHAAANPEWSMGAAVARYLERSG